MAGKGDKRRPTDEKKYATNWERIFGAKDNEEETEDKQEVQEANKNK